MKYILDKKYGLRSWQDKPYAAYKSNIPNCITFTKEEFKTLLKCDGKTHLEKDDLIESMLNNGIVHQYKKANQGLTDWQKLQTFKNRYLPVINLQITGKCNYNCRHCFNCKDNARLNSELKYDNILKLLDQAKLCGVQAFILTGGEPMLHPNFLQIVEEIYKRDMFVFEINTNGYFINQEILEHLNSVACKPTIKISYDTSKFHDWMRCHTGAEKKAIAAIKLCIKNGFKVKVQMNINKMNHEDVLDSLIMLDKIGVNETRIIKTSNSPRWLANSNNQSFSFGEYYEYCTNLIKQYSKIRHNMDIGIWKMAKYIANYKSILIWPERFPDYYDCSNEPICSIIKHTLAVASDGSVYPCFQVQGLLNKNSVYFENVLESKLSDILNNSKLSQLVSTTCSQRFSFNDECNKCKYKNMCAGGCPALAMITNNNSFSDFLSKDKSKCIFFKEGHYKKLKDLQLKLIGD